MLWFLLLLLLVILAFGIWGAIKIAFWVVIIAVAVAVVLALLGRGVFAR